jgi:signal recognition particle receptor subunit beta
MAGGTLLPYLASAAHSLRDLLLRLNLPTPPEPLVIPAFLATLVAVVFGASLLLSLALSPARAARDAVLLLGASPPSTTAPAPGKTSLFHALRAGRAPAFGTVPTQAPSDAVFEVAGIAGAERWVDFPGHARLRPKLGRYLDAAKAVVFVVDATPAVFARTVREAADLLHDVLADAGVARARVPVLVFCNKGDVAGAVGVEDVRVRLEAEIERARKSKAAALRGAQNATVSGGEDAEGRAVVFLGYDDEVFEFGHVGCEVQFARGSAKLLDVVAVTDFVAGLK